VAALHGNGHDSLAVQFTVRVLTLEAPARLLYLGLSKADIQGGIWSASARRGGPTEIEIFTSLRQAMEVREGGRVPIIADVVSGPRTALTGGPPSARKFEPGELLIVDLVPRHRGHWGDSCNTCCAGEPRKEYKEAFDGLAAVLSDAIAKVRPGLQACGLDRQVRTGVAKLGGSYPHHTGHGLGISWRGVRPFGSKFTER
jgi:Xaa-Pro aminopeptidase